MKLFKIRKTCQFRKIPSLSVRVLAHKILVYYISKYDKDGNKKLTVISFLENEFAKNVLLV